MLVVLGCTSLQKGFVFDVKIRGLESQLKLTFVPKTEKQGVNSCEGQSDDKNTEAALSDSTKSTNKKE